MNFLMPASFTQGSIRAYLMAATGAIVFALFTSCETSSNDDGTSSGESIQLSVELPQSVAVESETSQSLSGTLDKPNSGAKNVTDDLREAFDVIREFAGIAESLGQVVGEFLVEVEQDAAAGGYDFSEPISGSEDGLLIQAGPSSAGRDKSIDIWHVASQIKVLEADWDGDFRGEDAFARGTIRMNGLIFDINGMFIEMHFDTSSDEYGHFMDIKVRGIPDAGFDTLDLFAAVNEGEVTVSGNVYFSDINVGESEPFFEGADRERNYMFVASADIDQDIAAIDIALPATDVNVASNQLDTIFDDYSYGDVYKLAVYDWVNTAAEPEVQGIKAYIESLGFDFSTGSADEFAAFMEEEVLPTLSGNEAQEVASVLFAFQLENSFYADGDGLVANGSDVPSADYESLAGNLSAVRNDLLVSPAVVRSYSSESSEQYLDFSRPDFPQ